MAVTFDTLSDATTATNGTGNFDELMQVVTLHLEAQFAAGRITGTDYATVYLGALQSTLAQAVTFALSMEKANADTALTVAQELKVDADKLLVDAQELKVDAEKLKVDSEKALLDQKKITEYAQTGTTSANTLPNGSSVAGKQITLFTEQAKGFKWNAENKYLKTLLDAYAINVSVSKVLDTATLKLQGGTATTSIKGVIDAMEPTG